MGVQGFGEGERGWPGVGEWVIMLSRSLTSCLIKPPANDCVSVINRICSLKKIKNGGALLGAARRRWWHMVIEDCGLLALRMCRRLRGYWVMDGGVRFDSNSRGAFARRGESHTANK